MVYCVTHMLMSEVSKQKKFCDELLLNLSAGTFLTWTFVAPYRTHTATIRYFLLSLLHPSELYNGITNLLSMDLVILFINHRNADTDLFNQGFQELHI